MRRGRAGQPARVHHNGHKKTPGNAGRFAWRANA